MKLKQYQNWLSLYLVCRRDGGHAMAAEFSASIVGYWQQQGNDVERKKGGLWLPRIKKK